MISTMIEQGLSLDLFADVAQVSPEYVGSDPGSAMKASPRVIKL